VPNLYDAHNHFQDERLAPVRDAALVELRRQNLRRMVVNGSCEQDWPAVLELAKTCPEVVPSFGYHPWHIKERSAEWQQNLKRFLDQVSSGIGEIGLDKWLKEYDMQDQEKVFTFQMNLAAERNLPVSIHGLQAWGRLYDLLRELPRPQCGFVLHSFGGPQEMISPLAKLGAYFSLPGYFAHPRKTSQREAFLQVPRERLLIETDDPRTGKPLNHPGNLLAVYEFAAEFFGESIEALASRIEENFNRLFGRLYRPVGQAFQPAG
jgi:TatD DNase family protein